MSQPIETLSQPINIPVSQTHYRLVADYCYFWQHANTQFRITVPIGFKYNGASVPRICWSITGLRPDGLIRAAATLHDFLYRYKGRLPANTLHREVKLHALKTAPEWVELNQPWTRKNADKLFARVMREAGVPKIQRRMAYLAVRLVGRFYWNK